MVDIPPEDRAMRGRGTQWPLIIGGLLAALIVGFLIAKLTGRGAGSTTTTASTSGLGNAMAPPIPSSGDGGIFPPASTTQTAGVAQPSQPGYPPPNMTIQAPPANLPAFSPSPGAAPASSGIADANGAPLLGIARAFLARPDQDRAMQAALRRKASDLPGLCPALSFVPGDTLVANVPSPMFDASGMMRRGLIRQRFTGVGCPNASPLFNVWIYVADPNTALRAVAGYMGTSRADLSLQRDATAIVFSIAARVLPQCRAFSVLDTRLPAGGQEGMSGPWAEEWLVRGCGGFVQLGVHFYPDRGGTRIEVPSTEAKSVSLR